MPEPVDNLSTPLRRMAQFFLVDALPPVRDVRDVYAYAKTLADRGILPTRGEERILRQVVWCMLQIQNDEEEGELHQALARLAALILAVMEDDDLAIPDDRRVPGRLGLEALAVALHMDCQQTELSIGVALGLHDLTVRGAPDVERIATTVPEPDADLDRALKGAALHLRQGEQMLVKQRDPAKRDAQTRRFQEACTRTTHLLARLLGIPATRDPAVVRSRLVHRELKRIEVDALGIERLSEKEQVEQAKQLLAWTQVDLGEAPSEENRARLAAELKLAVAGEDAGEGDDDAWLFRSMEG